MTITREELRTYVGKTLYDEQGNKIGKLGGFFLDDTTGLPEWVTVSTGFFGTNESFVPATEVSEHGDGLSVPFSKDKVKDAPNVDVDRGHLSVDEEANLYRYYGLEYSQEQSDSGLPAGGQTGGTTSTGFSDGTDSASTDSTYTDRTDSVVGPTDSYPDRGDSSFTDGTDPSSTDRSDSGYADSTATTTGSAGTLGDDAMTRSEEQLNVGTERVETGRARLRKWVETEHQQVDVPVRKEKVRLETEPVTGGTTGEAYSGPDITESEHEVTISEERPVVDTEVVPVERVKLTKDVEEETRTVDGEVRKERIDLDSDDNVDVRR